MAPGLLKASGSLGIDLNGLDISGTVDAAYYRAALQSLNLFSLFLKLAHLITSMRKRNHQQTQQKKMLMHHRQDSRVDKQDNRLEASREIEETTNNDTDGAVELMGTSEEESSGNQQTHPRYHFNR